MCLFFQMIFREMSHCSWGPVLLVTNIPNGCPIPMDVELMPPQYCSLSDALLLFSRGEWAWGTLIFSPAALCQVFQGLFGVSASASGHPFIPLWHANRSPRRRGHDLHGRDWRPSSCSGKPDLISHICWNFAPWVGVFPPTGVSAWLPAGNRREPEKACCAPWQTLVAKIRLMAHWDWPSREVGKRGSGGRVLLDVPLNTVSRSSLASALSYINSFHPPWRDAPTNTHTKPRHSVYAVELCKF